MYIFNKQIQILMQKLGNSAPTKQVLKGKVLTLMLLFSMAMPLVQAQNYPTTFDAKDIDHFWLAYDKMNATKDTSLQLKYLKELYLDKASAGLKGLIEVRNYSDRELRNAFTMYPNFWASIRANTLKVKTLYPEINAHIELLKKAYPDLKNNTIYFTMGAFRAGGTVHENKILIGSELSLADKNTIVHELPDWRQPFYKNQEPIKEIALLCTHEYVHTQQKELVYNLLSMCLYEGVAEFVSCKVTNKPSTTPAIAYGKANEKKVVEKFVADLFLMGNDNDWLWGENTNEFKIRDLGYYIGYEMCERYYNQATDKTKAIKELIELDFKNEKEVERIVDAAKLLPAPLETVYQNYEKSRPTVVKVLPFENGNEQVKPGLTKITIVFSEALVKYNTGLDYGPLGENHFPKIKPERVFGEDGKSWSFEANLEPNKQYQILVSSNFRKENGLRLKPFLLEFKTTN